MESTQIGALSTQDTQAAFTSDGRSLFSRAGRTGKFRKTRGACEAGSSGAAGAPLLPAEAPSDAAERPAAPIAAVLGTDTDAAEREILDAALSWILPAEKRTVAKFSAREKRAVLGSAEKWPAIRLRDVSPGMLHDCVLAFLLFYDGRLMDFGEEETRALLGKILRLSEPEAAALFLWTRHVLIGKAAASEAYVA